MIILIFLILIFFINLIIFLIEIQTFESFWMEYVNDDVLLTDLFIPGTHDSIAYNTNIKFISKCQKFTFKQQLNQGFRLFDIRLNKNLNCVHGICPCFNKYYKLLNLNSVMNQAQDFLLNHNETIILLIDVENYSNLDSKINSILNKYPIYEINNSRFPKLGEVRRKIVIIKKYKFNLPKQDEWKSINLIRKIIMFKQAQDNNSILINQLNIAWIPFLWSSILNFVFNNYLIKFSNYPQWILVDYGNGKIASQIYRLNFHYEKF